MPRISQLPSLTAADNSDEIAIVDVSSSTTKKITRGDLLKAPLPANSVTTAAIQDGAVTSDKIDFATLTPAVRAAVAGEDPITTGVYKTKSLALQANVVYVVHASIEWIGGGGGNKRIAFRVGETEVDSHRIEGSTQTNMTLIGLIRPLTSGPFQFDISISNIVGAATGTIGLTRYNAMPIMTTAAIG